MNPEANPIAVLDFGAQYSKLIARRVREAKVFSLIVPYNISLEELRALNPSGIIFSGGPESVHAPDAPMPDPGIFDLGIPILGICYGAQLIAQMSGGVVERADKREYGIAHLHSTIANGILEGMSDEWPSPWSLWGAHL